MAYVLPEYWGKRGVFLTGGVFYGAGEAAPDEVFKPAAHPFGQTNNQSAPFDENLVVGGGREIETAYPRSTFVPVVLRYQAHQWSSGAQWRFSADCRFRNRNYPGKPDFIVKGRKEIWDYNHRWYDDYTFNFGFVTLSLSYEKKTREGE
jgi:hypothetical protein